MPQALKLEELSDQLDNTHLVGEITVNRMHIERAFGEPTFYGSSDDKVTVEWVIVFDDGTVATIYDWKRYDLGSPLIDEMYSWHIGGKNYEAMYLVKQALEKERLVV